MNTLQFDYANSTLIEYEDFLDTNKNIPIKNTETVIESKRIIKNICYIFRRY